MKATQERILSILRSIDRPGMGKVTEQLESLGYFKARCYGHHKYQGGMADHALEVYHDMLASNNSFDPDTIAVVALFHDLGKAVHKGETYGYGHHPERSIRVLDKLGLELKPVERDAIIQHHHRGYRCNRLRNSLTHSDCNSASGRC